MMCSESFTLCIKLVVTCAEWHIEYVDFSLLSVKCMHDLLQCACVIYTDNYRLGDTYRYIIQSKEVVVFCLQWDDLSLGPVLCCDFAFSLFVVLDFAFVHFLPATFFVGLS